MHTNPQQNSSFLLHLRQRESQQFLLLLFTSLTNKQCKKKPAFTHKKHNSAMS